MDTPRISASVMLHGFADLGIGGGNRPTVTLELEREGLTEDARRAKHPALDGDGDRLVMVDAAGRIRVLLILLKAIASG